jgi:hypothetical protein
LTVAARFSMETLPSKGTASNTPQSNRVFKAGRIWN